MSEITQRQKLEQGRAKHAYEAAEKAKKSKDYKQYAKKVPMLIKTNGLGATLAFMAAKGGAYKTILDNIQEWLKEDVKFKSILSEIKGAEGKDDLMAKIVNCDSFQYRTLTIEVLAYLGWLRRFADALNENK